MTKWLLYLPTLDCKWMWCLEFVVPIQLEFTECACFSRINHSPFLCTHHDFLVESIDCLDMYFLHNRLIHFSADKYYQKGHHLSINKMFIFPGYKNNISFFSAFDGTLEFDLRTFKTVVFSLSDIFCAAV